VNDEQAANLVAATEHVANTLEKLVELLNKIVERLEKEGV
jgi:hypothetical protein